MSLVSYDAAKNDLNSNPDDEQEVVVESASTEQIASLKSIIVALSLKLKAKEVTDQQCETLKQMLADSEVS